VLCIQQVWGKFCRKLLAESHRSVTAAPLVQLSLREWTANPSDRDPPLTGSVYRQQQRGVITLLSVSWRVCRVDNQQLEPYPISPQPPLPSTSHCLATLPTPLSRVLPFLALILTPPLPPRLSCALPLGPDSAACRPTISPTQFHFVITRADFASSSQYQ
jgi:hypothetical protein